MQRPPSVTSHPAFLPVGTVVGPWRVVAWAGQGVYGAVYRAVRVGQEQAEPVALKVALLPRDPRFPREGALLSRLDHPSIPRLIDAGEWQHPCGTRHPYLAMEWIDGVPLYDWALEHGPDSRQVLRFLAQLARALQALHAQGALHRDVKGDNVLVRRTDGRAVLMDFGSGIYPGAPTLTPHILPPGTPAYRSPEAGLFDLNFSRVPSARFLATPADDLYALGVTACRLVTGKYPDFSEPWKDEAGLWQVEAVVPPAELLHDAHIEPPLRALILRMLSVRPEARGTAEELAAALELAATPPSSKRAGPVRPRVHARSWQPWVAVAAAGLALAIGWWAASGQPAQEPALAQAETVAPDKPDAGTIGLGDSAAITSPESSPESPAPEAMAEDTLPEPRPGQTRPDVKGRCPHKGLVSLNSGCWAETTVDSEGCPKLGGQMYKGTCYVPFIPPGRNPTSNPLDKR